MKRIKVNLDTRNALMTFVHLCEKQNFPVFLTDGKNEFRVSAKSTLGCILAQVEWEEVFCEYNSEHGNEFERLLAKNQLTVY